MGGRDQVNSDQIEVCKLKPITTKSQVLVSGRGWKRKDLELLVNTVPQVDRDMVLGVYGPEASIYQNTWEIQKMLAYEVGFRPFQQSFGHVMQEALLEGCHSRTTEIVSTGEISHHGKSILGNRNPKRMRCFS
jgi:hypothetical protein